MGIKQETLENYHLNSLKREAYLNWYSDQMKNPDGSSSISGVILGGMKATYTSQNSFSNVGLNKIRTNMFQINPSIVKQTNKMIQKQLDNGEIPLYIQKMYNYHSLIVAHKTGSEDTIKMSSQILFILKKCYNGINYTQNVNIDESEKDRYDFHPNLQSHILSGYLIGPTRLLFTLKKMFKTMLFVGTFFFLFYSLATLITGEFSLGGSIGIGISWGIIVGILWMIFGKFYIAIASSIYGQIDYSKGKYVN